jgi:Adenosine deaminase
MNPQGSGRRPNPTPAPDLLTQPVGVFPLSAFKRTLLLGIFMTARKVSRSLKVASLGTILIVVALPVWSKNCKKGKPCGNSCIPVTSQCHIGSASPVYRPSASPVVPTPVETRVNSQPPVQSGVATSGSPTQSPVTCGGDPVWPWVSSYADGVYFRATCTAAQDLSPANRRYFPTEEAAQAAGYRRSKTPDC